MVRIQSLFDRPEIDRVFHYIMVVGCSKLFRIDRLMENFCRAHTPEMVDDSFSDLIPAVVQNRVFFRKPKGLQHFRILPKARNFRVVFCKLFHFFRSQFLVLSVFQNGQHVQFSLFLFCCADRHCVCDRSLLTADLRLNVRLAKENARTSPCVLSLRADFFLISRIPYVDGLERW